MDSELLLILAVIFALVGGVALGWVLGSRPIAEWRARQAATEAEARETEAKYLRTLVDLEVAKERAGNADGLVAELSGIRAERDSLSTELATLRANAANFADQKAGLIEAQDSLKREFEAAGAKILESAQATFLTRAQDRFAESEKTSEARIKALLDPVDKTLAEYKAQVSKFEQDRIDGFGQLDGLIKSVRDGQERVLDGANRISTSIRGATKMVGDWGELQFLNLLDSCGLSDRTDFQCQVSVKGDGVLLRPDGVINIPGGRKLVVDVKNVFNTYSAANDAANNDERISLLRAHAREVRGHIDDLSAKRYQDHIPGSADFVVMFIPGEHVIYSAISMDKDLLSYALSKNVVLSSPLNFMSIALTVATIWRHSNAHSDSQEITRLGKELYDQLGVVAGHISGLRKSLQSTNQHFDALVGSFDGKLRRTGEKFEKLAVDTSAKDLLEAPPLNISPRKLSHFPDID